MADRHFLQTNSIPSYVRRGTRRTSVAQKKALRESWHRYGLENSMTPFDFGSIFHSDSPLIIDIGCGRTDSTLQHAKRHPENRYLLIETDIASLGYVLIRAIRLGLKNIRLLNADAITVFKHRIRPGSVDEIHVFFPDPWPKKRHHKRRLIRTHFLDLMCHTVKPFGRIFLATDWQEYALHMLSLCDNHPRLRNLAGAGNFSPRPTWRQPTKYEQRGLQSGHRIYDIYLCLDAKPFRPDSNLHTGNKTHVIT